MDVLAGPTFTIDDNSENQKDDGSFRRVMERPQFFAADDSSESSSSIGTQDDSGAEEEEAHSKLNRGIGLDSLEESLPIKKGLSGHFDGKSKSFTDLSQVSSVKELQKKENPFNKRRRLLMASRYRRSAFYNWSNPKSMPLLPLHEEEEECRKIESPPSLSSSSSSSLTEEKKQEDQILLRRRQKTAPESTRLRPGNFNLRSFSLTDLKEHDDEEEEEDGA